MMKLLAGNGCPDLANKIASIVHEGLVDTKLTKFSDGEIRFEVNHHVRGDDVFVIQSTCAPANDNIMELAIILDTLRRSASGRIIAVIPYYGYSRQDRRLSYQRTPITSRLVAILLEAAGVEYVVTVDIHSEQQQGFFSVPFVNLHASNVFLTHIKSLFEDLSNIIFVSPDIGGTRRTQELAEQLNVPIAIIDKRRPEPNVAEVQNIVGDIKGKTCILIDDIVDTAGTLCESSHALIEHGAQKVYAYITHPVLSGDAIENLACSSIDTLYTTDTIPLNNEAAKYAEDTGHIQVLTMSNLLSEAIHRIHANKSISEMYKNKEEDVICTFQEKHGEEPN